MKNRLLVLTMIGALAASPVLAQSEETAAEAETPATDTPVGGDLDLGETEASPAQPSQQGPRTYIADTFTDWQLQCIEVPEGEDVCQMYQLITDGQGSSVAEVSIFKLANNDRAAAGGTFVVPLETLLTQKLTVQVDSGPARRYDFSFCNRVGCYARVGFTAEDIQRFRAGAVAKVTIVPALAPDQQVTVDMSLAGFTAAYEAASVVSQ